MFEVGEAKSWISLVGGAVVIAVGTILLLMSSGIVDLPLPSPSLVVMLVLLAVSSVLLIYDGFMAFGMHVMWGLFSLIIGGLVLVGSVALLLGALGAIGFTLPFVTLLLLQILLVIIGALILIGAFMF